MKNKICAPSCMETVLHNGGSAVSFLWLVLFSSAGFYDGLSVSQYGNWSCRMYWKFSVSNHELSLWRYDQMRLPIRDYFGISNLCPEGGMEMEASGTNGVYDLWTCQRSVHREMQCARYGYCYCLLTVLMTTAGVTNVARYVKCHFWYACGW